MHDILKKNSLIIYLVIVFIGILTISYQLNFENFWLDEMTSFWISDPALSLDETIIRQKKADFHNPILFNLILKEFLNFTKYEPNTSRLLPLIFGSITILLFGILSYQIKKDSSFLLTTFLTSISIYIIKYSQEVRPYSLLLMLSTINIYLYSLILNELIKNKFYNYLIIFIFIIISILNYSTNPFSLIIFFSQIIHMIFIFFYINKKNNLLIFSLLTILFFYLLTNYSYLIYQISFSSYMLSADISNVIDGLYFPRFFGSKIMGYVYLSSFLFLIFFQNKKIINNTNYSFLFIIFIFSYLVPFIYGIIRTPVLLDRYIIFVLIPVIVLISCLSNEIKSKKIKHFIIAILIISTLFNHYLEILKRKNTKPEFINMIEYIKNNSLEKNIIVKELYPNLDLVFNYLNNIDENVKKNLNLTSLNKKIPKNINGFWLVCYKPAKNINCDITENKKWKLQRVKKTYLVEAKLFKLN